MTQINSYLTFGGNCREAMNFYKDCLGGELTLQTIGESPLADKMPVAMKECILHSTLTKGNLILMGSDMVGEKGLVKGNAVSLAINCSSEEEIKTFYEKLSAGGTKDHALEQSFLGATFGDLTDKYGNHWLLNFEKVKLKFPITKIKKMKTNKIIFWVTTTLIFLFEGVMPALTSQTEMAKEGIRHLGYPEYFGVMLTVFKVLGALALIIPQVPARVKEWAYAGFAISLIAAFVSNAAVDGFTGLAFFPLIVLAVLVVSYIYYHKIKTVAVN